MLLFRKNLNKNFYILASLAIGLKLSKNWELDTKIELICQYQ